MARTRKKDGLPFYEGAEKTRKLKDLQEQAVRIEQAATAVGVTQFLQLDIWPNSGECTDLPPVYRANEIAR